MRPAAAFPLMLALSLATTPTAPGGADETPAAPVTPPTDPEPGPTYGSDTLHLHVMPGRHFELRHAAKAGGGADAVTVGVYHIPSGLIELNRIEWPGSDADMPVSGNYSWAHFLEAMRYWPAVDYTRPALETVAHEVYCHAWQPEAPHAGGGLCGPLIAPDFAELDAALAEMGARYGYVDVTIYDDGDHFRHAWDR